MFRWQPLVFPWGMYSRYIFKSHQAMCGSWYLPGQVWWMDGWKLLLSFWEGLYTEAMFVSGRVRWISETFKEAKGFNMASWFLSPIVNIPVLWICHGIFSVNTFQPLFESGLVEFYRGLLVGGFCGSNVVCWLEDSAAPMNPANSSHDDYLYSYIFFGWNVKELQFYVKGCTISSD